MQDLLHQELLTLQQNLQQIHKAKVQIEVMQNTAQEVVKGVQMIQQQYETYLPDLLRQLTQHQAQEFEHLQQLNGKAFAQLANDFHNTQQQIAQYYEKQHYEINENLGKYKEMVRVTTQLSEQIGQIDFPQRFVALEQRVQGIHEAVQADLIELIQVRKNQDEHLATVEASHQAFTKQLTLQTAQQLNHAIITIEEKTEKIQHDFSILHQQQTSQITQHNRDIQNLLQQVEAKITEITTSTTQLNQELTQHSIHTNFQLSQELEKQHQNMLHTFQQQQLHLQQFISQYQHLVAYTQAVEKTIISIDFPKKLQQVGQAVVHLEQNNTEQFSLLRLEWQKQSTDLDTKIGLYKKQTDNQLQLIENQQLLLNQQIEHAQQKGQQQLITLQQDLLNVLQNQHQQLQEQLKIQNQQLVYLLVAIICIGLFVLLQFLWTLLN